jgi:hypothetical protein
MPGRVDRFPLGPPPPGRYVPVNVCTDVTLHGIEGVVLR